VGSGDCLRALEEARLLGPQANWALGAYRKLVPYQSAATFTAFGYAKAEAGLAAEPEALPEPSAA
jgi:hypothetical protein